MIPKDIILPQLPLDATDEQKLFFESLLRAISDINSKMYENVLPVGALYVRFPGASDPGDLFPGKWDESDEYDSYQIVLDGCTVYTMVA